MAGPWDTPPTAEEQSAAATGWETPPTGDEFARAAQDVELERRSRIAQLADIMGATANVDRKAAVLEIATKTGAPPDFVESQFDFWKGLADQHVSPQEFYERNPELAAIALDQPWLGELVTRDKPLNTLQRFLGDFRQMVGFTELDELEREMYGAPQFEGPNRSFLRFFDPARAIPGEVETPGVSPPVQQEVLQKGSTSRLTGLRRQLGGYVEGKWVPGIYQYRAGKSWEGTELGALGLKFAGAVLAGEDGYEYRKQALALRNVPPEDLRANGAEQLLLGVADLSASEMLSTGAALLGIGAGALLAGPGGAAKGGAIGKTLGGLASFGTSFVMEFGNVWDFLEQKDDQGRPMDPEVAVGAGIGYAAMAAAIETGVNLGPWAKLLGPLGREGAKREVATFLKAIAKDPTKKALLARVAKQWAKTAVEEGLGEETAQGIISDLWGWYTRSRSAGLAEGKTFEPQRADPLASIGENIDVGLSVTASTALLGLPFGARHYVATRNEFERSFRSERTIEAINGAIPDSPTAKGAPALFARAVELETQASGEPVKAAFIDPAGITRLGQEANVDPVEMVRQAAGEDAARRFQEAAATGTKLEVPLAEYVSTWHQSGLAAALAPDTTTRSTGVLTPRERETQKAEIQAQVKKLVDEVGAEKDQPGPNEQLLTQIAKDLADAGKMKPSRVEPQVKLWRKFIRTEAVRNGMDVDDVAKNLVLRIAAAHAEVAPIQALLQPTAAVTVAPTDSGHELRFPGAPLRLKLEEGERGLHATLLDLGVPETKENLRRWGGQGFSTALYLRALQLAKERGVGFESDVIRSDATERMYARLRALGVPFEVAGEKLTVHRVSAEQLARVDLDRAERLNEAEAEIKSLRRVAQDQAALAKDSSAGPRGWLDTVRKGAQRLASIFLADTADLSTFLHETGHAFFELKADLAEAPLAPELETDVDAAARKERSRADFQAALEFMGVKDRAELDVRGREATAIRARAEGEKRALTTDERARVKELLEPFERWARGFEAFLMEGRAPSLSLAGAFRTFKLWLESVYRSALSLNVNLTPEIRGVFDRMLATDAEIAEAGRQIGITGPALEAAKSRAEITALKEVQRATETWWKDELRAETERAQARYDRMPEVIAWRFLRGVATGVQALAIFGAEKLDKETVVAAVGQRTADTVFKGMLQKDGIHPDHLGAALGFPTGQALLDAMINRDDRATYVSTEADAAMAAKHPGILEERARLQDLVAKALHDEPAVVEELHRQLLEDRKKAGREGPAIEALRAAARIILGRQLEQQVDPRRYYFAERDALRRRAKAEAKGDAEAAALASQQRLLNFYLHREATLAVERSEQVQELAEKLLAQKGQDQLGKASPAFRDFVQRLLHQVGLVDVVPAEVENVGLLELGKALEAQDLEADFDTDAIAALLQRPRAFGDLTVSDVANLHDALKQIRRAARNRNTVVLNGQRVALDALVGDARSEIARLPKKAPPPEVASQRGVKQGPVWTTAQGFIATITDPLTTYLDDDYLGPTVRAAIRDRYYRQRTVEHELFDLVATKVQAAFDGMPKEMRRRLFDEVDRSMLPRIPGQRRDGKVDRSWMLQILANLGNTSNAQRMLEGRGWALQQVLEFFRVNRLTEEEARFVEGLWKLNDEHLFGRIAAVHEAVNGTKPQKIEAAPLTLELADGKTITLSGGYWPAMYDPKESALGKKQEDVSTVNEANYEVFRASLLKGFTRRRAADFADVVRLDDFGHYPAHVLKVIRYIAYEEFVRDAGRVFAAIKNDVEDRLGEPAYQQLDRWLHVVASGQPDSVGTVERYMLRGMGLVTSRVVLTAMILNVRNALADLVTPLMTITGPRTARVRADYLLGSLLEGTAGLVAPAKAGLGWWAMREHALATFPELRVRANESARRMRDQFERFGAGGKRWQPLRAVGSRVEPGRLLDWIHHHGFILQHVAEVWGTTIAAEARYRQEKARGTPEAEAVRRAEDVVQKIWPSHLPAEQSALIRSPAFRGMGVFMQGFFNRMANRTRQTLHPAMVEWANAEGWGGHAKAALSASESGFMVLGLWFVMNVLGSLIEGRGPEDGEETFDWMKRKMVSAPLVQLPFLNELAPVVEAAVADGRVKGKLKYSASERASPAISSLFRIMDSLGRLTDENAEDPKRFWAAYEVLGLALGLPVSQVKRTGQYLYDLEAGENASVVKMIYGDSPRAPQNPAEVLGLEE